MISVEMLCGISANVGAVVWMTNSVPSISCSQNRSNTRHFLHNSHWSATVLFNIGEQRHRLKLQRLTVRYSHGCILGVSQEMATWKLFHMKINPIHHQFQSLYIALWCESWFAWTASWAATYQWPHCDWLSSCNWHDCTWWSCCCSIAETRKGKNIQRICLRCQRSLH